MMMLVCIEIPRCDTNGVGAYEVTVISELSRASRKNKETERSTENYILGRPRQRD